MKKNYFIIFALYCLCSCSDEIDFPRPIHEPAIVLFATINQEKAEIFVTNTVDPQLGNRPGGLNGAAVKIEDTNGDILLNQIANNGIILADILPQNGEEYKITVEKNGFETIQSSYHMPPSFKIESFNIELSDSITLDSNNFRLFYTVTIELKEPSEDIEYFEVVSVFPATRIVQVDDTTTTTASGLAAFPNFFPIQSSDVIELETSDNFFIKNTGKKQIQFGVEFNLKTDESIDEIELTIKSSTQEKYDYESSVINQLRSDNSTLTLNPLEVLTNVENGYGFFAAHHIDTIQRRIPK